MFFSDHDRSKESGEVTFCRDAGRAFQAIAASTRYDFTHTVFR